MLNLWGHFNDWVLRACDEVCGKKGRTRKGDTWWLNKKVEAISAKKMHRRQCVGIVQ